MKNIFCHVIRFLVLTSLPSQSFAQVPTVESLGWSAHVIHTKLSGDIHYYVTLNKEQEKKPVLLYLDGSGSYPLFQNTERGTGSTVLLPYKKLSDSFHIVLISKPGTPFIDSIKMDPVQGIPLSKTSPEYTKRLSLDWRVTAADEVLKEVLANYKVQKDKIAVIGLSEGFQVAAKLIAVNKSVTHAVLMIGNGLTQFYDFIIQNRVDAQSGQVPYEVAQQNIDSIYKTIGDIYNNPVSTDKEWLGHSYLRWNSFCSNQPVEQILSANIPTYIVACSKDRNTSVLSTDYIRLEALRMKRTNIEYKVYPYDHSFSEMIFDAAGNPSGRRSHVKEIIDEAINWIKFF